ncbi:Zinc finger, SWIM-type [uncultured Caudovirales phage]|uniref:Zinc finger, SWIM-type n=1 Tax=uncultured Caudovirales phage TaxID=2100421 RepID=A0A6J5LZG0_9CAUD|nr:Zinc finger, SWIM-type [uncultured Caudovirales phage]
MKVLKEITEWDTPNHIYFANDSKDKIYAYIKASGTEVERFRKPIKFSVSRRKFKEIPNRWNFSVDDQPEVVITGQQYQVPGSRGAIYTVINDAGSWSCTCPASKWQKGDCKHIVQLKSETVG